MQGIYCPSLTEDSVIWKLLLLYKTELYCAYAFIMSWEVVYKKKKIRHWYNPFFFIPCPNYHFNSAWISDLYIMETSMKVERSGFFLTMKFCIFLRIWYTCQLQPISHSSKQHKCIFLLFPSWCKQSHDLQGLTRLTILTYSHHISKMMLLSLYGCTLLLQSREQ